MDEHRDEQAAAEELLRSALVDPGASVALSLRVDGLGLAQALTVVFHGRQDLGTIQTYIANGGHGEGQTLGARDLLRVPCDLDLADAESRDEAQEAYAEQARALRDALVAADTVLSVWREPLADLADEEVRLLRSVDLHVGPPAHALMPLALVAPEKHLLVVPVCGARSLAEGRPPLGIALAQQDVVHVYPLPDDPQACLEDFSARAAEHAHATAQRLTKQDASVRRFLQISGEEGFADTA